MHERFTTAAWHTPAFATPPALRRRSTESRRVQCRPAPTGNAGSGSLPPADQGYLLPVGEIPMECAGGGVHELLGDGAHRQADPVGYQLYTTRDVELLTLIRRPHGSGCPPSGMARQGGPSGCPRVKGTSIPCGSGGVATKRVDMTMLAQQSGRVPQHVLHDVQFGRAPPALMVRTCTRHAPDPTSRRTDAGRAPSSKGNGSCPWHHCSTAWRDPAW